MKNQRLRGTVQFFLIVTVIVGLILFGEQTLEDSFSSLWPETKEQFEDNLIAPSYSPLPIPTADPELTATSSASVSAGVVSEVIDGDTIRLASGETVRYIGIDTPETSNPRVAKECFGQEAGLANESLVLGNTVQLEKDVSERDRYGRLLRYVWVDGVMVNEVLVRQGYAEARAYPPDTKYQQLFWEAEQQAMSENKGMWSACTTTEALD